MIVNTDVDIDIADRSKILKIIKHTPAMISDKKGQRKHNTGVYFHEMPENPFTGISTIDHKEAEVKGFFKIDLLNVNIYEGIKSQDELEQLIEIEPNWELLNHSDIVKKLFHIHGHFDIVSKLTPTSVEQLAAVLAIIRPAKRYLLDKDWNTIMSEVWKKPKNDEYFFKQAHAIAYSMAIVLQMNMLVRDYSLVD
jgi:hypothetical protein